MHGNGGMQPRGRLPGLEADARDRLAMGARAGHGQAAAIAGDDMAAGDEAAGLDLQPLHRTVDIANGAARGALLAQHMPGLERLPHFKLHAAMFHHAAEREAELALGLEPFGLEGVARPAQIAEHAQKVLPDEMRQHEFVMQGGAPAHQLALLGLAPEPGDERAQQQLLGETHARVRRHLEGAEFEQAQAPCGAIG